MTMRAQHYIEVSDILAIRLECKNCGASVSFPIAKDLRFEALNACPNCSAPWLGFPASSTITPAVSDFAAAIAKTASVLKEWDNTLATVHQKGFAFSLEVSQPDVK
ncbi:MAG: hypothetical protein KGL39_41245 [Patescibacteria group bacterium]|nr:hypothetical protein [Patescibacteria group bacterium]